MEYDSCGALWVINPVCVNVVSLNGTVSRVVGLTGLPRNHSQSIAADDGIAGEQRGPAGAGLRLQKNAENPCAFLLFASMCCRGSSWLFVGA